MAEAVEHLALILPDTLDTVNLGSCSGAVCVWTVPLQRSPDFGL